MTTYTTITNALVAVGAKPFATTIQALRDNPIAIGEADATVPAGLLPTVLLGTLATPSGTTVTLSGLALTPYKFVFAVFNGVSFTAVGSVSVTISFAGPVVYAATSSGTTIRGVAMLDLSNGVGFSSVGSLFPAAPSSSEVPARALRSSITTASTSISVTLTGGNAFSGGSISIYGMK